MQALTLPARRGWRWLFDGFLIFRKNHLMFSLIVLSYWMMMAVVNAVPVVGQIVVTLCLPFFSVSLMNACRLIDQSSPLSPRILLSGFYENPRTLLTLGAIYLFATFGILALSALVDGGVLFQFMVAGELPDEQAQASGDYIGATQLGLSLFVPLVMAYWYAPVLAAWHGLSAGKALFFSFVACLRNWRAFLAYVLAVVIFGTLVPAFVLGLLSSSLGAGNSVLSTFLTVLVVLVIAPAMYASFYVSYRDVFVVIDEDA